MSAEETMCLHFGLTMDGVQEQCINPEAFANFLNLLESISFHDDSSHESSDYAMPNSRYASFYNTMDLYSLNSFSFLTLNRKIGLI